MLDVGGSCPLNVDPRVLLKKRALGDFKGAYKYYKSKVFFPEIISAACSRSCLGQLKNKKTCALITNIEKTCANMQFGRKKDQLILRGGGKTIAVIGGGLTGIAEAVFFRSRNYEVHIYEKTNRLGGKLNKIVPNNIIRRELYEPVDRLGACVFYNSQVESEDICLQYDAVCNTAIVDWKGLQIKNLFHAFGTAAEYRIAAAVYAGEQIVKYL